jgi:hypothetical protein
LMQPVFRLVTLWIPCGWQLNITENQLLECINHETMQLNGPSNNHSYITIYKRVGVNLLTWLHWNWALATEVAGLRHVETILYWGFTVINHPQQQYDIYIIHTHIYIYIHTLFRLHINRYLIVFILCIYIYTRIINHLGALYKSTQAFMYPQIKRKVRMVYCSGSNIIRFKYWKPILTTNRRFRNTSRIRREIIKCAECLESILLFLGWERVTPT